MSLGGSLKCSVNKKQKSSYSGHVIYSLKLTKETVDAINANPNEIFCHFGNKTLEIGGQSFALNTKEENLFECYQRSGDSITFLGNVVQKLMVKTEVTGNVLDGLRKAEKQIQPGHTTQRISEPNRNTQLKNQKRANSDNNNANLNNKKPKIGTSSASSGGNNSGVELDQELKAKLLKLLAIHPLSLQDILIKLGLKTETSVLPILEKICYTTNQLHHLKQSCYEDIRIAEWDCTEEEQKLLIENTKKALLKMGKTEYEVSKKLRSNFPASPFLENTNNNNPPVKWHSSTPLSSSNTTLNVNSNTTSTPSAKSTQSANTHTSSSSNSNSNSNLNANANIYSNSNSNSVTSSEANGNVQFEIPKNPEDPVRSLDEFNQKKQSFQSLYSHYKNWLDQINHHNQNLEGLKKELRQATNAAEKSKITEKVNNYSEDKKFAKLKEDFLALHSALQSIKNALKNFANSYNNLSAS